MEINLTKRQRQLIDILRREPSFVSAKKLAELIGVSEKTIRNEVTAVNESMRETVISSMKSKGYQLLDKQRWISVLNANDGNERLDIFVLKELIMHSDADYYALADMFFISTSALNKTIAKLNQEIEAIFPSIHIVRENNRLHFNCDDIEKRKVLTYFLFEESEKQSFDISVLKKYFKTIDVTELSEILFHYVKETEQETMDFDLLSRLLHLLLIISNPQNLCSTFNCETALPHYVFLKELKDKMNISFSAEGIRLLNKVFQRRQKADKSAHTDLQFEKFSSVVFREIFEIYTINFNDDLELKQRLTAHLRHLKTRCLQNKQIKNPLLEQIKKTYVLGYDIAVYICMRFQDFTGYLPDENEISFIALHVLSGLQRIRTGSVRIAVINPYENAVTSVIESSLSSIPFVKVVGNFSAFDVKGLHKEKPDLIITLANIDMESSCLIYKINNYLDEKEYLEIQQIIRQIRVKKAYENTIIRNYFNENLFVVRDTCCNKNEIIDLLCDKLEAENFVGKDFREQVYMREGIAATSFGGSFAIPHPVKKIAKNNAVAVAILKHPVMWNGFEVRIVFLFALHKSFDQVPKLYEMLLNILDNKETFHKLLDAKSFDEFIQYLLS